MNIAVEDRKDQILFIKKIVEVTKKLSPCTTCYVFTSEYELSFHIPSENIVYALPPFDFANHILQIVHDVRTCVTPTPYFVFILDNPPIEYRTQAMKKLYIELIKHKIPIFVITPTIKKHLFWQPPYSKIRIVKNKEDIRILYHRLPWILKERAGDPNDFFLVERFTECFYFIPRDVIEQVGTDE
jgi:hypothetical protein